MKYAHLMRLPHLALFVALASTSLAGATWYVDGVNGSDINNCLSSQSACKTIGHAISLASSGDSIMVAAATYTESLVISMNLNVIGSGSGMTIVDGGGVNRVLMINNQGIPHVNISNLTIRNGLAAFGAGILNYGILTLNESTVSGNLAFPPLRYPGYGGGVYNSGQMTINDSTITGNSAWIGTLGAAYGGGIYNGAILTINNSTITGNGAGSHCCFSQGGGIYNSGGTVTIDNSTVSANTSSYRGIGGNIYNTGGTVALRNSIVANSANGNCSGGVASRGYNLSSDQTCTFSNSGDLNNTDPKLGTLGYYGGPTQTIPLLSGSPAIDAGNPSGCTDGQGVLLKADQRGMPRPDSEDKSGCDMGAYESQSD